MKISYIFIIFLDVYKKYSVHFLVGILFFIFVKSCSYNKKIHNLNELNKKIEIKIDSLNTKLDSVPYKINKERLDLLNYLDDTISTFDRRPQTMKIQKIIKNEKFKTSY